MLLSYQSKLYTTSKKKTIRSNKKMNVYLQNVANAPRIPPFCSRIFFVEAMELPKKYFNAMIMENTRFHGKKNLVKKLSNSKPTWLLP